MINGKEVIQCIQCISFKFDQPDYQSQSPGFHLGAVDEDPAPNQWAPIRGKGVADVQDVSSVMPFEGGVVAGVPPSP